tara:strand:+ start:10992 stop:11216 length:225 start_codon:yes stop_codon:yes gene_type:complete
MNIYYLSLLSSVIYFLVNVLYFKFYKKEEVNTKNILQNSILIFIIIIISYNILSNFVIIEKETVPKVFLNNPDF